MPSDPTPEVGTADAVTDLARNHSGQVLAVLANRFGNLDLADEAVQEALARAAIRWGADEPIPDNPGGWLMTVARRIAIDLVRSRGSADRRLARAAPELVLRDGSEAAPLIDHARIQEDGLDVTGDDQLRLILLCCHPALSQEAQVSLTLRLVAGLTTEEIAAGFLAPTPTIAQRITRAKRKIRDAGIPLAIPDDLHERLAMVRSVLYLTFNEGYLSRSGAEGPLRHDLCTTAVQLTRSLRELAPNDPETLGLLALQLYHDSRRGTRFTADSELVQLDDQDRSAWDSAAIAEANALVRDAMAELRPGRYQMQALIASCHANATTAAATDWIRIEALYSQLKAMAPSPVVDLNHAIAVAKVLGPQAGLDQMDSIEGLETYHLYHSTRAYLLATVGDAGAAQDSWKLARSLTSNPAEQEFLDRKIR